ncbi:hypothetical protein RFI_13237 [Reticulomyxa filosa]|uniref:Uncharacterized protein n=1 Tax=Reticulomyxa filosa TaxID=46433 RepID=X6ND82_RETFI|nr:hypothetical protein RFI_13237 [Reticulomyxa filosa]|eukprot:ETO23921.1 hypothetical protein RFI_13237 [Reticulomyxa filosa]
MVRCTLAFSSIEELWGGIELVASLENLNKHDDTDSKTDISTKLSIMRCVNQFATMKKGLHYRETIGEPGLPIPITNVELRFSVITSVEQKDNEAIGIVGEVVLTLKPLFEFQKKSAELAEIIKLKEKIDKCSETKFSFDQRLRIAGTDGRSLAPLFVKESHRFTEDCIRAKDAYGKSLLTRFLQDKDTPADLIRNYVQCIPKPLMPEIWKAKIDAGRTPLMLILQNHNASVIKAALEGIPNYLREFCLYIYIYIHI